MPSLRAVPCRGGAGGALPLFQYCEAALRQPILASQVGQLAKDSKRERREPGAKKIHIYTDRRTRQPKGDATVTFQDEAAAEAAVEFFHNAEYIPGARVTRSQPAAPQPRARATVHPPLRKGRSAGSSPDGIRAAPP